MLKPFGIIPAMVTPVTQEDEINETALRKLTDYLIDGGIHGVFAIGSQGEFWAFTAEEKRRVWEVVVEQTAGRAPVYAGTAAPTTREAIQLTQSAEDCGVDAVSILTPYFISPNENELYDHYKAIADATSLPIVLYSNPARTGVAISPKLISRLSEIENIVGIKDSSGDVQLTMQYIDQTADDFAILMGRDTLIYVGLLIGAKGAIAATGNVVPGLVAQIYDRFISGDHEGAKAAQEALAPLRHAFAWGTFPVVIKEAVDLIGLQAGPARLPVGPMNAEQRERLREVLKGMDVLK
jgi:4-hydroxy-tetrahydrodipicolinate synthase